MRTQRHNFNEKNDGMMKKYLWMNKKQTFQEGRKKNGHPFRGGPSNRG